METETTNTTGRPPRGRRPSPNVLAVADERLVSAREILQRFPFSRATLNRLITTRQFPTPIRLTPSKLLWRWSTILAWLDERERNPVARREFRLKRRAKSLS